MPLRLPPLSESDLANLRESGLTDATIRRAGIYTEHDEHRVAELLNRGPSSIIGIGGAMILPHHDLDGVKNCHLQVRPHFPRLGKNGKPIKYESPLGSSLHAYYPPMPANLVKLRDPYWPLHLTEGAKKALALAQLDLAAVSISGAWCGCKKDTEELIADLLALPLAGRIVFIILDRDAKESTQQDVAAALQRLVKALRKAGARPIVVDLPAEPGEKVGVDDFMVKHGAAAFHQLVANTVIRIISSGGSGDRNSVIKIIPPTLHEAARLGFVGRFLKAVEPFTEATDAAVLAHLLPAVGMLIGAGPHIYAGQAQPARINCAVVGPTNSGRKGTSFAPVDLLMKRAIADFWAQQKASGLSSGEGVIARLADRVERDKEGNEQVIEVEKRLLVIEPEFSRVLANTRREGNILSQVMRECYDSGDLCTMTVIHRQANGAHVCIVAHITPEELSLRLTDLDAASGFGNRFLWFLVRSDKLMPKTDPIPSGIFDAFAPRLIELLNLGARSRCIRLDAPAQKHWERIYPALREDREGFAGALTARGSSMVLRVALIYALIEGKKSIGIEHLEAAIAVWSYNLASVQLLFGSKSGDDLGDKVLRLLGGGPMTRNEMNRHLSENQKAQIGEVLVRLENANLIRQSEKKHEGAGRPAVQWELVSDRQP